jgi:ribosomal protein S5
LASTPPHAQPVLTASTNSVRKIASRLTTVVGSVNGNVSNGLMKRRPLLIAIQPANQARRKATMD